MLHRLTTSALALCLLATPALACEDWRLTRVIDGDTVKVETIWGEESVRFPGIDTPEVDWRADCPQEALWAAEARDAVTELLSDPEALCWRWTGGIYGKKRDRFDRILARVYINGRDLNEILLEEGLAQPWPREREWCE